MISISVSIRAGNSIGIRGFDYDKAPCLGLNGSLFEVRVLYCLVIVAGRLQVQCHLRRE